MKKLIANYHTHTYRCRHAKDVKDEEYVLEAIKNNYKVLGFSDHAPFKNIHHLGMRMDMDEITNYIDSIHLLKQKYSKKIKIHLGFEIEYYEDKDDYYKELKEKYGIEYLILGQHNRYDISGNPIYYFDFTDDIEGIKNYKNDLIKGIKSGHFLYVCHPDLFMNHVKNINKEIDKVIEEICITAKEYDIPLEININGEVNNKKYALKKGNLYYPSPYFFKKAKEIGNKFIFGVDAHDPDMFNKIPYDYFDDFFKETGITEKDIIDKIKL